MGAPTSTVTVGFTVAGPAAAVVAEAEVTYIAVRGGAGTPLPAALRPS